MFCLHVLLPSLFSQYSKHVLLIKMLRKLSTKFGKSKKDEVNGVNGRDGASTTDGVETNGSHTNGAQTNGASSDKSGLAKNRSSFGFAPKKSKPQSADHAASRGEVESSFTQFAQLIHASRRPLPTQSGDGAYLDHKEPSGLFSDLKAMGFKDVHTLIDVMKNKATGDLQDDKTYLMEHTIQVCCTRQTHCVPR